MPIFYVLVWIEGSNSFRAWPGQTDHGTNKEDLEQDSCRLEPSEKLCRYKEKTIRIQEGDHEFLKITPITGISRVIKVKKLSPWFIGPFQILKLIGSVTYQIALPPHLSNLHNDFHISQLRGYHPDPSHYLEPKSI